jgi:DNA polymerase V
MKIPLYLTPVYAGFPGATSDYVERSLDLNEYMVSHPTSTFFVRASGQSMINAGINDGDILVVDRSIEPKNGKVVIAVLDGDFTVKRVLKRGERLFLMPENPAYQPIEVKEDDSMEIWGTITFVIHEPS